MKYLVIIFMSVTSITFGQKNFKEVISETIKNYDYSRIDSLARTIGYKGGETVKTNVNFKVNHKGETFDISATGPENIFIVESEKIIRSFPKLEFNTELKEGQHYMFNLPVTYIIESERKYKKRIKKQKKKEKN